MKNLDILLTILLTAITTLKDLRATRTAGAHGVRRQLRRAEEAVAEATIAYNTAYAAEKANAASNFEAEEDAARRARRVEIIDTFRTSRKEAKAEKKARRAEQVAANKEAAQKRRAELAAKKAKAEAAAQFEREEAQIRRHNLEEAVDLFKVFVLHQINKEKAEKITEQATSVISAAPRQRRNEVFTSIANRIAEMREMAKESFDKKVSLGEEISALKKAQKNADKAYLNALKDALNTKTELKKAYANFGFDFEPANVRINNELAALRWNRTTIKADLAERIAELKAEIRALNNVRFDAVAEAKGLSKALVRASYDKVDAPFVLAVLEKIKVADKRKPSAEIREATKVEQKEPVKSFPARNFGSRIIYSAYQKGVNASIWKPEYIEGTETLTDKSQKLLDEAIEACGVLLKKGNADMDKPFCVNHKSGTVVHLPATLTTKVYGIPTDEDGIRGEVIVMDHKTEELFSQIHPMVWGAGDPVMGAIIRDEFIKKMYARMDKHGVIVDGEIHYVTDHASASQMKAEKVVMALETLRRTHERVFYFGKTEDKFNRENRIVGPDLMKAWANISRPWSFDLQYADGTLAQPKDILLTAHPEYIYVHDRAIYIGDVYGKSAKGNPINYKMADKAKNSVGLFLGQIGVWKPMAVNGGQLDGYGLKGLVFYCGGSILDEVCRRAGITREEFFNAKVKNLDGEWVRVGDYKGIATDDVWKFDKFFPSYAAYLRTVDELAEKYPVIGKLGILRQTEDEEGEWKRRHMTRSIFQQLFSWSMTEVSKLVKPSAMKLKAQLAYEGAIRKLAGLGKDERTPIEYLFGIAPFLFANNGVQRYWRNKIRKLLDELMACRLDAKGQYPYIVQDPVAMFEILVLGKKPEEAGILEAGYFSAADMPDNRKALVVRFPANFLTIKVLVNKAMKEVFADLGNICALSIHDDILVRQDGDTDGDEICILYNGLLIELAERMLAEIKPPVVVFEHGNKVDKRQAILTKDHLQELIANARYMASHNDQTGIYADLARDCGWLAAMAYAVGDMKMFSSWLIGMAAASTGAIISIDQVKGQDVSEVLVDWLNEIARSRSKALYRMKPFTQHFLKGIELDKCARPDMRWLPDAISVEVRNQVCGEQTDDAHPEGILPECEMPFVWNAEAAWNAVTLKNVKNYAVRSHALDRAILDFFGSTVYNDKTMDKNGVETDIDADFKDKVRNGAPVGLKDLYVYCWHNALALMQSCEGELLYEKRQEYFVKVWDMLVHFAMTDGSEHTAAEKKYSVYVNTVNYALELTHGNGMNDESGSFTWFLLNVVAAPMASVIAKNGWKVEDFAHKGNLVTVEVPEDATEVVQEKIRENLDMYGTDSREFEDHDASVLDDGTFEVSDDMPDDIPEELM